MIIHRATEAKLVLALTSHRGHDLVELVSLYATVDGEFAVRSWTPFKIL